MARKRRKAKRSLPYRKIKLFRSARTGKVVSKKFRGKKKVSYGYISNLTGKRISRKTASKNPRVQGFREAFPNRSETTRRRIRRTIAEYRKLGFNPIDESPGLKRYFAWLRENKPKLLKPVLRAVGERMQAGTLDHVVSVESETEQDIANAKRNRASKQKARKGRKAP